jgi:hypothetical protein
MYISVIPVFDPVFRICDMYISAIPEFLICASELLICTQSYVGFPMGNDDEAPPSEENIFIRKPDLDVL